MFSSIEIFRESFKPRDAEIDVGRINALLVPPCLTAVSAPLFYCSHLLGIKILNMQVLFIDPWSQGKHISVLGSFKLR